MSCSYFFLVRLISLISVEGPGNTLQNNERRQGKAQLLWQAHEEPGGGATEDGRNSVPLQPLHQCHSFSKSQQPFWECFDRKIVDVWRCLATFSLSFLSMGILSSTAIGRH